MPQRRLKGIPMRSAAGITPKLELLTEGAGGPAIVVVDFIPFSSATRLGPLLCTRHTDQQIYQIDPVADLTPVDSYIPLRDLSSAYSRALAAMGAADQPLVIVGYCSAAALSLQICVDLAPRGEVFPLLVQPTRPDTEMVAAEFSRIRASLGVPAGECPPLDGTQKSILETLQTQLRHDLTAMAQTKGLDPASTVFTDFLARYRSWLGFLLASGEPIRPFPGQPSAGVIVSNDDEENLPWLDPFPHWVKKLGVDQEDLAASPVLAEEILSYQKG